MLVPFCHYFGHFDFIFTPIFDTFDSNPWNGSKQSPKGSRGVQRGPEWSKWPQNGLKWPQNGLKYPKMAFSRPNLPKSSPERAHPALEDGWNWDCDRSAEGILAQFTISAKKCTYLTPPAIYIADPPAMYIADPPSYVHS